MEVQYKWFFIAKIIYVVLLRVRHNDRHKQALSLFKTDGVIVKSGVCKK